MLYFYFIQRDSFTILNDHSNLNEVKPGLSSVDLAVVHCFSSSSTFSFYFDAKKDGFMSS